MSKRRVGILTGGGDCPGLNAVIRGVTKCAIGDHGMEVIGFQDGFEGMITGKFIFITYEMVSGILTHGGTILGTSNKADPFAYFSESGGKKEKTDVSDKCVQIYNDLGLDALICVGGDGTMTVAGKFAEKGINVVGVPKTIDKDLMETDTTFGFDTAMTTATEAFDKLHTTAQAHHRVMLAEVMGRNAGWLALESGIAGGGDIILIPEIPYDIEEVISIVRKRSRFGKRFSMIVVSEGALPIGGKQVVQRVLADSPEPIRLGGISNLIAKQIEDVTGIECRTAILGHLQRGGTPTPRDRMLATHFAVKAMELVMTSKYNEVVVLKGSDVTSVPVEKVAGKQKLVPVDAPLIKVALSVGTSFGIKM